MKAIFSYWVIVKNLSLDVSTGMFYFLLQGVAIREDTEQVLVVQDQQKVRKILIPHEY